MIGSRIKRQGYGPAFFLSGLPGLLVLLLATAWCYFPGLRGPFLFDDFNLLPDLALYGGVDDWSGFLQFVANDSTGPIGRPLTLASFLLNATNWPADPFWFKFTNLLIHLLAGLLLYFLIRKLLGQDADDTRQTTALAALLSAGLWLLNPFNVSTTLYVVQRMAMLSALFTLAGLLCFVHGRTLLVAAPRAGYLWMSLGILGFTPLAVLSKENGALLPMLALVLEHTVLRHRLRLPPANRVWEGLLLWLPSLLIATVLTRHAGPDHYAGREFDLAQRLMTEGRVLFDYVYHLFNPFAVSRGLLADDYPLSTGLLSPWTTLPALAGWVGLLLWALWQRARHPLLALAILFFLGGHVMESTVLPLEIYFEHRNYLPAVFLVLPLAAWAAEQRRRWRLAPMLAGVVVLALAFQTHRLAGNWASDSKLAKWWAAHYPESVRLQDYVASTLSDLGRPDLAAAVLEAALARHPDSSHLYLHHLVEKCRAGGYTPRDWARLLPQLERHPVDLRGYGLLGGIVRGTPDPQCVGVTSAQVLRLLDGQAAQPKVRQDGLAMRQLEHMRGIMLLKLGRGPDALTAFQASTRLWSDISVGMQQVALLASFGHHALALGWLEQVARLPRPQHWREKLRTQNYEQDIRRLRDNLTQELAGQSTRTPAANP